MSSTRFSSADAAWLHMDRPTNLMVINSVMLFEQPVDWELVKQLTQERMVDPYPRFRQRVVESRLPLRAPKWVDDEEFALEHHMHHLALPAPGDVATYAGIGPPEADQRGSHAVGPLAGADPLVELLAGLRRIGSGLVRQGIDIATSPSHAARLAGAIGRDGATALRLVLTPADTATAIKGDPGISRRVAWSEPVLLARIKQIAHQHKATVNDVLLAAVSGALRHYLLDRGSPVGEIQAMVPFNLRPLDQPVPRKLGNKFGLVFLPLPVGSSGSYRRLVEVHHRMQELKTGRDGPVSYGLLSAAGLTPEPVERRIIDMFTAKTTAVMTNVPGPREPVYLAGAPVRTVIVWAPTSGHIGMSVSIFSYRGEVTVGLMTDAVLIPDPQEIVAQLDRELRSLNKVNHRRARTRRATTRRRAPTEH